MLVRILIDRVVTMTTMIVVVVDMMGMCVRRNLRPIGGRSLPFLTTSWMVRLPDVCPETAIPTRVKMSLHCSDGSVVVDRCHDHVQTRGAPTTM
jgi:hypothetical protein